MFKKSVILMTVFTLVFLFVTDLRGNISSLKQLKKENEYKLQHRHYNKMLEIFKNDPSAKKYIEVPFRPPAYLRGKQKIVKRASYV
ncbi:hypothetical protein J7J58_06210, partial [candidate division WOR-3 bacterium]|nr:hypothetical protein [candidate division WOR-3 bacterium]